MLYGENVMPIEPPEDPGVYKVLIRAPCRISGTSWHLNGRVFRKSKIQYNFKPLPIIPFNLSDLPNTPVARSYLADYRWKPMSPPLDIQIANLNEGELPIEPLSWGSHGHTVAWSSIIIIACILMLLAVLGFVVLRKRMYRWLQKHSKPLVATTASVSDTTPIPVFVKAPSFRFANIYPKIINRVTEPSAPTTDYASPT